MDTSLFLLRVSGTDRPGQTAALTKVLGRHDVRILDIGQAVIHDQLSLGMLVELSHEKDKSQGPVLKDVLFEAYELGVQIRFSPVTAEAYRAWVKDQGIQRYKISVLSRGLNAEHLSRVTGVIAEAGLNIRAIERLSGRVGLDSNEPARTCIELSVRGSGKDADRARPQLLSLVDELGVDIAFQPDDIYRRNRRLIAFDMDSTLIQAEVIVRLAEEAGVGKQVSEITEQAMHGELDFAESFEARIKLLQGLPESTLQKVAESLPLTEGAERLCASLKKLGYKLVLISGGFTYFAEYLKARLGFDYVFANELEIADGVLTGRHVGEIVDAQKKAEHLRTVAEREGISMAQTIAVGDGANDLPMLSQAGLGIAFHAKPIVRAKAQHALTTMGLDAILYLLGLRDWETSKPLIDA